LLARTYDEAELRRRLAMLVEAAAPWWAYDEAALSAEERARLYRLTLVGLPEAGDSLLADLLDDRRLSCFSTGDDHQVVVAQVIQGLPLTALARQAESRTGEASGVPNLLVALRSLDIRAENLVWTALWTPNVKTSECYQLVRAAGRKPPTSWGLRPAIRVRAQFPRLGRGRR